MATAISVACAPSAWERRASPITRLKRPIWASTRARNFYRLLRCQFSRPTLVHKSADWQSKRAAGKGLAPSGAEIWMPYKANKSRRHKIPKARYRVENWAT